MANVTLDPKKVLELQLAAAKRRVETAEGAVEGASSLEQQVQQISTPTTGAGLAKGALAFVAARDKKKKREAVNEALKEFEASIAERAKVVEEAQQLKDAQMAATESIVPSILEFRDTGDLEQFKTNIKNIGNAHLKPLGRTVTEASVDASNPSLVTLNFLDKDGTEGVSQLNLSEGAASLSKVNPELAKELSGAIAGLNPIDLQARQADRIAQATGRDPQEVRDIEFGLAKPVQRTETGAPGDFQRLGEPQAKETAKLDAQAIEESRQVADQAQNTISALDQAVIPLTGAGTGPGQSTVGKGVAFLGSLIGKESSQRQRDLLARVDIQSMNDALTKLRELSGPDSDRDVQNALRVSVNIENEPETNARILFKAKAAAQVLSERPVFVEQWVRANGSTRNTNDQGETFSQSWMGRQRQVFNESEKRIERTIQNFDQIEQVVKTGLEEGVPESRIREALEQKGYFLP